MWSRFAPVQAACCSVCDAAEAPVSARCRRSIAARPSPAVGRAAALLPHSCWHLQRTRSVGSPSPVPSNSPPHDEFYPLGTCPVFLFSSCSVLRGKFVSFANTSDDSQATTRHKEGISLSGGARPVSGAIFISCNEQQPCSPPGLLGGAYGREAVRCLLYISRGLPCLLEAAQGLGQGVLRLSERRAEGGSIIS